MIINRKTYIYTKIRYKTKQNRKSSLLSSLFHTRKLFLHANLHARNSMLATKMYHKKCLTTKNPIQLLFKTVWGIILNDFF